MSNVGQSDGLDRSGAKGVNIRGWYSEKEERREKSFWIVMLFYGYEEREGKEDCEREKQ